MSNTIVTKLKLQRLLGAAANIQSLINDGRLSAALNEHDADGLADVVASFDMLSDAATAVQGEQKTASPFLRYRREIMAENTCGAMLRRMVLSMYGSAMLINIRAIIERFDEHGQRIVLELLSSYMANGDRDSQFMGLALELVELVTHEAVEVAA